MPNMKDADRTSTMRRYLSRISGRAKSAVEALTEAGVPIVQVPATRKPGSDAAGQAGTRRKGERGRVTR